MRSFAILAVPLGRGEHPRSELRRTGQSSDLEDLLLPERLPRDQRRRERAELPAMYGEQPPRLLVALGNDPLHFRVDLARRLLAVGPLAREHAPGAAEVLVLARRELHEPELVAHPPPRHHPPRDRRRLLDVVLRAGGLRAVDDLLRVAPA